MLTLCGAKYIFVKLITGEMKGNFNRNFILKNKLSCRESKITLIEEIIVKPYTYVLF